MIQNILTFCVKNDLTFVDGSLPSGKLVANDINRNSIYLITPFDNAIVKANFQTNLQSDKPTSVLGFLVDGNIEVKEIVSESSTYYPLVKDWHIYEFKVPSTTLQFISRNRTGQIGINFSIEQRLIPAIKSTYGTYGGEIINGAGINTPQGEVYYYINKTIGFNHYGVDYDLNDIVVEDADNMDAYKISAYSNRGSTPTTMFSVDPSVLNDNFETIEPSLTAQIVSQVNENVNDIVLILQAIGVSDATLVSFGNRISVAEQDIDKIEDGTTIVGKALADSLGNVVKDSYVSAVYPTYNTTTDKLFIETYSVEDGLMANNEVVLPKATATKNGLMSATDKSKVDSLWALLENNDENFVDTINELLEIFQNYPESMDIVTEFAKKADKTYVDNELAKKADKLVLTNYAKNGNMSSTTDYGTYGGTLSANANILTLTGGNITTAPSVRQDTNAVLSDGIKLYIAIKVKHTNKQPTAFEMLAYGNSPLALIKNMTISNPTLNSEYFMSMIAEPTTQTTNLRVLLNPKYIDITTAENSTTQFRELIVVNLTETFGKGKEPTEEQMDRIIQAKGFFQTTDITIKDLMLLGFSQEATLPDITLPTEFVEKYENILNGKFNNLLAYNEYEDENLKKMVKVVLKGNNNTPTGQVKLKLKSLSENLLQFNNMKTATNNGVWAEIEDGVCKLHGTATGGTAYIMVELKEPVTLSDSYSFIVTCNQITVSNLQVVLQKGTVPKTTLNGVNSNNDVSSRSYSTINAGEIATSIELRVPDGINVDGFEIRPQLNNGNFSRDTKAFDNNFGEKEIIIDSLSGEKIIYLEANSRKFSLELEDANGTVNLSDSYFIVVGAVEKSVKDILTLNEDQKLNLQAIARYNLHSTNHRRWTMLISTDIHGEWDMVERQIEYLNKNNEIMYAMCLGDIVYNNALDPHQGFIDAVKKTRKPYYITLGNHDSGTGVSAATGNTQQQMFDKFIDPLKKYMKLPSVTTNYYSQLFDSSTEGNTSTRKVALVVLNSYDIPDTTTGGNFIVTRGVIGYSQEQIDWLCTTLLEIPANYVLVISSHALNEKTEVKKCRFSQLGVTSIFGNIEQEGFNLISDIIEAWINGTSLTQSYTQGANMPTISVNVDFSTRGTGLFSCYITGHTHKDLIGNIKKYPNQTIVNLTCTTKEYGQTEPFSDLPRVKGEKSEDALTLISIDNLSGTTSLFRVGADVTHNAINRDMISFDFDGNIID